MDNKILAKAQGIIDERRQYAEDVARNFLMQAYKNNDFRDSYNNLKELEIQTARCEAYGEKVDRKPMQELKTKLEFILKDMGLNGTDLEPNYECRLCNDTGYIKGKPCECLKKEINNVLLSYSGFQDRLPTFEENEIDNPAFSFMKKWCETKNEKYNVIIWGPTGTGKTYLTECVASKLIEQNRIVLYTTAFNLNNALLNYHISFDPKRNEIIEPYLSCEALIIDDLGSEPMIRNVTKEYLYLIINERLLNHLPTIITTNLTPVDILNTYDERIYSRLMSKKTSVSISLDGEDLRIKK